MCIHTRTKVTRKNQLVWFKQNSKNYRDMKLICHPNSVESFLKKTKDKILQFLQPIFPSPLGARANLSWTQNHWQIFQPPLNIMETKSFITVKCQRFTIMHLISSLFCFWKKALYSVKEIRVYFLFIELDSLHLASTSPNMKHKEKEE